MPGAAAQTASMTASGVADPVGLFGEVRKTRSGWCRLTAAAASAGSRPKSLARSAAIHLVEVVWLISGCIEYDGSKPSALRPGPPKTWNNCWMISFDPFAAQVLALVRSCPR